MITAKNIGDRLGELPFRPFRICLSDGTEFPIPHREFAWVWRSRIFVGMERPGAIQDDPRVREISGLHITRLEDM
jgi:hypothetical protein